MEFIKELWQLLNQNWFGSIVSLAALFAAFWLGRAFNKSRLGARLVYQRRALPLIGSEEAALPPDVEVRFKGQLVERLTKTYLVFWNSGNQMLRGTDIVADDPLRWEFSDESRVLEIRSIKSASPANKIQVTTDPSRPNRALISFDYLNPSDGTVIEVLHTDSKRYPTAKGMIRGLPAAMLDWGRVLPARRRDSPFIFRNIKHVAYIAGVMGLIVLVVGILIPDTTLTELFSESGTVKAVQAVRIAMIVVGSMYCALPVGILWVLRRRFPKSLNTPELED